MTDGISQGIANGGGVTMLTDDDMQWLENALNLALPEEVPPTGEQWKDERYAAMVNRGTAIMRKLAQLRAENERLREAFKTFIGEVDDYVGWLAEQDVLENVSELDEVCDKARAALEDNDD